MVALKNECNHSQKRLINQMLIAARWTQTKRSLHLYMYLCIFDLFYNLHLHFVIVFFLFDTLMIVLHIRCVSVLCPTLEAANVI